MKMNRRNALIGLGAIATGGGAIFGSGAFSQVQADRTVSVQLAGDGSALLSLNPQNTTVASTTNGTLNLDFSGNASGVNYDAITEWENVFTIVNNGDSDVGIYFEQGPAAPTDLEIDTTDHRFFYNSDGSGGLDTSADPIFEFVDDSSNSSDGAVPGSGSNGLVDDDGSYTITLTQGSTMNVSVRFDTTGVDSSLVTEGNELINEITINAI